MLIFGVTPEGKKIHWRRWEVLAKTKEACGLGFRELELFNKALLTKMDKRVNKEPNALWVRVLKGLYYTRCEFLVSTKGARASWGWASLLHG